MKKSLIQFITIIPLALLLCLTFSCQKQGEEVAEEAGLGSLSDEDVAAIKSGTEAFLQAWRSSDGEAFAALYTVDAIVMPPNESIIQGRGAIKASNEASPPTIEADLTIEDIDGRGDLAYVRGTYSLTIQPEGAPEPIRDTGKYIEIRRKQQDGSWLIAIDIWNSDLPLPSEPQ